MRRSTGPQLLGDFTALVDWPGASFWPELSAANPDALGAAVGTDPDAWYTSASNTIFTALSGTDDELGPWLAAMRRLLAERFSDQFADRDAMVEAFERHNERVRREVPADRLLEWTATDGWGPICERLGVRVPDEPFPLTNTTEEFQAMLAAATESGPLGSGAAAPD